MKVNTVLGPIDTKKLGKTLMHEHILCANWTARMNYPDWLNRKELIDMAVSMLKRLKDCGFDTIVDGTPPALGRDVSVLKEVSEKAEINIIASTGFYWYEMWKKEYKAQNVKPESLNARQTDTDFRRKTDIC